MASRTFNNVRLGLFVISGLAFLVFMLYMIGKNKNLFGTSFLLSARFENVQGLKPGNNVRYAGIEIGTVDEVTILNDTLIEVSMHLKKEMKNYIRKNAVASIGMDGLVGNKVVNITSMDGPAPFVQEGDILKVRALPDTDEMLRTLGKTNNDLSDITSNLKITIDKVNASTALWQVLNDEALPRHLRSSFANLEAATKKADNFVFALNSIVTDVKKGKGSLGAVLTDTTLVNKLNEALIKIRSAGEEADTLGMQLNAFVTKVKHKVENGEGIVNALLTDTAMVSSVNASLENIENATASFNENMEALKHNFLFRGYFRKLERQKEKKKR